MAIPFSESWFEKHRKMIYSKPYIKLSLKARAVLDYFLAKVPINPRTEPDRYYSHIFNLTYSEAERMGIKEKTFTLAIKELIKAGFLGQISKGGLRGNREDKSEFTLSNAWMSGGYSYEA